MPVFLRKNANMHSLKYARIERERRFLLDRFPNDLKVTRVRRIADRYIEGTMLRLRIQTDDDGPAVFKLTQKIPARAEGAQQGLITNVHLSKEEFDLLAQLPARPLSKIRHSVSPFGIDVFEDDLEGLVLAEAEFDSAAAANGLCLPSFLVAEISADDRFTGGRLVRASREDLRLWLTEYGLGLTPG
ncbi:MAG TPA: hypothetical protein VMB02_02105 [Candidatus Aquilonibacter sp.]|nr:hypothetical protein [Candidatus Aquilonibacter sp.]